MGGFALGLALMLFAPLAVTALFAGEVAWAIGMALPAWALFEFWKHRQEG